MKIISILFDYEKVYISEINFFFKNKIYLNLMLLLDDVELLNSNEQCDYNINEIIKYDDEIIYDNKSKINLFEHNDGFMTTEINNVNKLPTFISNNKENTISFRKLHADSIRKKIKVKAFEAIKKLLNKILKLSQQFEFKKLPQNFIKDVGIYNNKLAHNKTIRELFTTDFGNICKKKSNHNKAIIDKIVQEGLDNKGILEVKVKDLITQYFQSKYFIKDYKHIEEHEGSTYAELFKQYAIGGKDITGYINYYENSQYNITKNLKAKNSFN